MLTSIVVSLGVVFLAELGDKSQLITLTYALRHRWWVVLTGVGIASLLVHGLSVTIGHFLGLSLPAQPIAFAAAIAFFGFAFWTWRENSTGRTNRLPPNTDDSAEGPSAESSVQVAEHRFIIMAVVSSFVLAELGDKTMLATVALASDHNWLGVWIGATVGMVLADGAAIAAGILLHRRLPERFLHTMASVLFLLFGVWILLDSALGLRPLAIAATAAVTIAAAATGTVGYLRARQVRHGQIGPVDQTA